MDWRRGSSLRRAPWFSGSTWIAIRTRQGRPYLAWGWFWFLGTLVPVIGIVQVGVQSHADRYAYIPSIGILVAVTWLAASFLEVSRIARTVGAATAVALVGVLGVVASNQVHSWRDSEAVWRRALAVTTDNWQAWAGLGDALSESGRPAEAVEALSRSLAIRPGNAVAWNGLGVALGQLGRVADAVPRFQQAVQLDPGYADAWYNLGTALGNLGQPVLAVQALEKAVALQPASARFWANLAIARSAAGDGAAAADALRQVERLDPEAARRLRRE